jgi:D-alanyl-D-alanine carboxypeptidase
MIFAALTLATLSQASTPAQADRWEDVPARLEAIRAAADLPALGAIRVTLDGVEGPWVAGTRRAGGEERVEPGDLWHLGSCTKSMTATLIALLVKRGDLSWDTPLGEMLPDLATEMHVDYLDLTLVELLNHRAGLVANPPPGIGYGGSDPEDLVALRGELTHALLKLAPVHAPRGAFLYSNAGFMIAGHCAEVATGRQWEDLMRELLFEPLGMKSAGFGPPGKAGAADQPRAHRADGTPVEPGPEADNPPAIGPAGTVHASLEDWARYVRLHLAGAHGDVTVGEITLTQDDLALLHAAYEAPGQPYAFGWLVMERPWAGGDGRALYHNGSNSMWYCVAWLGLENGVAALVTTNRFDPRANAAVDQVASLLLAPESEPASGR